MSEQATPEDAVLTPKMIKDILGQLDDVMSEICRIANDAPHNSKAWNLIVSSGMEVENVTHQLQEMLKEGE